MNDNDKKDFQQIFNGLSDYYQREPLNANALRIYFAGLQQYSLSQVQWAASKHLADSDEGQFYPKVAHLVKHLESRGLSDNDIIAEARLAQTPFGVMARIHIGHHSLNTGDPFYLKERAAEVRMRLPEWQKRAIAGQYTDHEISRMLRHEVSPSQPFVDGLPPLDNKLMLDRVERIANSDEHIKYLAKFEDDAQEPVNQEGQLKIANMMSDTFKRGEQ